MDLTVLVALNAALIHHHRLGALVVGFVHLAPFAIVALLALLVLTGRVGVRRGAITGGGGGVLAILLSQVVTALVDRPRPFALHPELVHNFLQHGFDRSFPSDSITAAFAIAVGVFLYSRRWGGALLVLATAFAIGRVAVGVHYPSDVLVGAAIGMVVACLLVRPAPRRVIARVADGLGRWATQLWIGLAVRVQQQA